MTEFLGTQIDILCKSKSISCSYWYRSGSIVDSLQMVPNIIVGITDSDIFISMRALVEAHEI